MKDQTDSADVIVIGGGAAGLMCAFQAAARGKRVIVLDRNRQLGRKLRITGKGRCNVTNQCSIHDFMQNIPGDGRFLYSALNRFSPADTISFFESNGVPLKTERGNRVFPISDRADDIADVLVNLCNCKNVSFRRISADQILVDDMGVTGVHTTEGMIACNAVVLCTGGLSYPLTGTDGTGYKLAKSLGHTITALRPSLIPLESDDAFCKKLQGFSLKNVVLRAYEDDRLIYKELGEMLFTHFGVSGPLVLSASSHMRNVEKKGYRLEIDLKPGLDEEKLDLRILRDFSQFSNKSLANLLPGLVGRSMAPVVLDLAELDGRIPVNQVSAEQRSRIRKVLKAFPISICGMRPIAEAIVTAGGVSTKEINPRTMESKIVSRLYFAGEIMDLDAYTGGFNLQIAWSTGYVAGNSV